MLTALCNEFQGFQTEDRRHQTNTQGDRRLKQFDNTTKRDKPTQRFEIFFDDGLRLTNSHFSDNSEVLDSLRQTNTRIEGECEN